MSLRRLLPVPLAVAAGLVAAAPACAGGLVSVADGTLSYAGDSIEPLNVTISAISGEDGDTLVLEENGTRITADATSGCTVSTDGYEATCPAAGVDRLHVTTGDAGSDVRIRADLPALVEGGDGDDLLIGGPADDVVDGGRGQDVIGGGGGADELRGGPDSDLVTYVDRIGRGDALLPRTKGVTVRIGAAGASGQRGEHDTIARDVELVEGGDGDDRFELRDGRYQSVACNGGRDVAILDPLDDAGIDCPSAEVAPARGARMTTPTLVFPFPAREDTGRSRIRVEPVLSLQSGAIALRIRCEVPIGILAADGPGCDGRVALVRAGGETMATRSFEAPRGRTVTWRVPLHSSRALARRAQGLSVTVSALPTRGAGVRRDVSFTVKG